MKKENNNIENNFFYESDLDSEKAGKMVVDSLFNTDDGELYIENSQSESLTLDDGTIKTANFDSARGFGLRAVVDEVTGYAYSSEISKKALENSSQSVQAAKSGYSGNIDQSPNKTNSNFYKSDNPISKQSFDSKIKILKELDNFARSLDSRVRQVSANLSGSWKAVKIIRSDGLELDDIRPLVRLNVSITIESKNGKMEVGSYGSGGRYNYDKLMNPETWKYHVSEALRQANVMIESKEAPAGEMQVVLGPGWPGILLHEAIGHGLEGDFNRKKTSVFSNLMGELVASKNVTVVDDGTLYNRRGSLNIDDEGTPTQCTTLIENGKLVNYMQDRLNARLMNTKSTGNGRRQSFAHQPMPRMRNTIMQNGNIDQEEIIKSVSKGIYASSFGGGQVDITSGKFVFSANEAYMIEDGKITNPIKGATLIGSGFEVLKKVKAVGNDLKLDPGIGTCGKNGQGVPVGVGQPSLLINGLTVGGTDS